VTAQVRHALKQIDSQSAALQRPFNGRSGGRTGPGAAVPRDAGGVFAALAALLAAIGIYGVLSYLVTQRTREIGIRISLGVSRTRVLGKLLGESLRLIMAGLAAGIGAAYLAGHILASLLHEVKPNDPAIFLATAALLAAIALVACYVPARRAARMDPMAALRHE
jgi:putative ABC transport system permease protein